MKRKSAILIFVLILASTTIVVGAQEGWFNFILNLAGLDESDRQMVDTFVLTDLPEYFEAGVVIEGSGYTGQIHTVDISIIHDRPDSSVWFASGDYSLDLETSGAVVEPIYSGSFTDLRNAAPFYSPTYSWYPSSSADTYDIVLSLDNIVWTIAARAIYDESRVIVTGEGISFTGITFDGETTNYYLENDTISFVATCVWDVDPAAPLNSITYNVHVRCGGDWIYVLGSLELGPIILAFNPAIPDQGTLDIANSFIQPAGTLGDWEISITVLSTT